MKSIVETVGLTERLAHKPSQLSGGQQQRVAAARALASRPQIVFADEPTGALDSRSGAELLGFLRNAVDELGQTVVMVTHDPSRRRLRRPRAVPRRRPHRRRDDRPDRRRRARLHEAPGGLTAMFTATVRGMLAHKLRLVLTTASIALGVAFLAGTLILTDTMKLAFDQLFGKVSAGTDAVVRQESAYDAVGRRRPQPRTDPGRGPRPRSRPSTASRAAEGSVSGYALLTDTEGKAVLTNGGAPTMGYSMPARQGAARRRRPPHRSRAARPARGRHRRQLGGEAPHRARLADQHPVPRPDARSSPSSAPSASAARRTSAARRRRTSTPPPRSRCSARPARSTRSTSRAADGVSAERRSPSGSTRSLPGGAEAVTGAQVAKESSDAIHEDFKFLNVMFSVFAGIALFVGSFIIWNTFTMIVTQRSREIALLRAVGATRRQVKRSLLVEAVLLGLGASAIGLGLGVGVAKGLNALMAAARLQPAQHVDADRAAHDRGLAARRHHRDRRRGARPGPAGDQGAAGRGAARGDARRTSGRRRCARSSASLLTAAGVAAILQRPVRRWRAKLVLARHRRLAVRRHHPAPLAARPLAAAIGAPLRLRGVPGDLARQNAMRNPRRTASTAAALMIGLTLVVSMGVFASSLKASFGDVLGDSTNADLFLAASSVAGGGLQPGGGQAVADGARRRTTVSADGLRRGPVRRRRRVVLVGRPGDGRAGAQARRVRRASAKDLGDDGVLVSNDGGRRHTLARGRHGAGGVRGDRQARPAGRRDLRPTKGFLGSDYVISLAAAAGALDGDSLDTTALVLLDKGADRGAVQDAITAPSPTTRTPRCSTRRSTRRRPAGVIDQLLTFVTVMLLLAVVIALLGIVNTLALSVFERTRELGLLRAVGMTRAQVRAMVRWESVIISLIGAASGAGLGIGLGVALSQSLKGDGITAISVPVPQIALYVVAGRGRRSGRGARPGPRRREGRRAQGGGHRLNGPGPSAGRGPSGSPPGRRRRACSRAESGSILR